MKLAIALASAGILLVSPAFAGQTLNLAPFTRVKASDGADVVIRHGAQQRVTLIAGSTQYSSLEVRDGKLTVETCNHWNCPRHYRLQVEIVMPAIAGLEAEDGARLAAQGNFPAQPQLAAKATDGGNVDVRAIAAAHVDATASDGGELSVQPRQSMNARAEDGGLVRYWGSPTVNQLIAEDGGSVRQEN